jgi:hypothetical protein
MRWLLCGVLSLLVFPALARAQDSYKVEALKQGTPEAIAPEIAGVLETQGYRILDGEGKPLAEIWLRKGIPASAKPSGAKGAIQFPFLAESELLGAVRFASEGHDYRDQSIPPGVYTMRYGLQPVNGDHLGVSPFRDYALLLPAAKDRTLKALPRKQLETQSAESAGSSHPAVFFLLSAPSDANAAPKMIRDEEKDTWRVVVPLSLSVQGESAPVTLPIAIIVSGMSEAA